MTHLTGLAPDREATRRAQSIMSPFVRNISDGPRSIETMVTAYGLSAQQSIYSIHEQQQPSCLGEALAACIEAKVKLRVSAIGIWREARRRQGKLEEITGSRIEYGLEGLVFRGWDPYEPGEELNLDEMLRNDDLDSEMAAFDNKEPDLEFHRIDTDRTTSAVLFDIDAALKAGCGVVVGSGITQSYMNYHASSPASERVLGTDAMGGDQNGHAQRIFAMRLMPDGTRQYGVQGSWGVNWGGMTLADGTWQPGCCWVKQEVLLGVWDIHTVKFRKI